MDSRRSVTVDEIISRIQRELPDTDRSRYDIAYARGRAQARSSMFFGGLTLGGLIGGALVFFLDPERGNARRAEFRQQAIGRWNDLSRTAEGRSRDMRNRLQGFAIESGLREPPTESSDVEVERVVVPIGARSSATARSSEEERLHLIGAGR
jgi:hypothetical protein